MKQKNYSMFMKNYILKIIKASILFLCFINSGIAQSLERQLLISKFEELDLSINNGEGYSKSLNDAGNLAWAESYLLDAYLEMYEVTLDQKFLKKFIKQANEVISNTDKARRLKDYKGRERIGWSATKYTIDNKPMVFGVHTGMIVYSLLKFALIVKNQSLKDYEKIAKDFISFSQLALKEFDNQYRFDVIKKEGFYQWEGEEPLKTDLKAPIPLNYQTALGRCLLLLYVLTNDNSYLEKTEGIAKYFKNNIKLENERYIWGYRAEIQKYPQVEDISHGAIDLEFSILCYKFGIVFERKDMFRFVNTFYNLKKDMGFYKFVNGTDDKPDKQYSNAPGNQSDAIGRWLDLSEFDCGVYDNVKDYFIKNKLESKKEHPQVLLGLAKLIKYWSVCEKR